MPSWLAVTGRIRQEMRVCLACVGAYLGLSWGTNSKASLCSSCFEGTANHLSARCITDNKGCKYWTRSTKLKTLHLGNQKEKKRRRHFVFRGQYFIFINLAAFKARGWVTAAKIRLYKSLFLDNNDADNIVSEVMPHTNFNFYVAFRFTCTFEKSCSTSALSHCSWLPLELRQSVFYHSVNEFKHCSSAGVSLGCSELSPLFGIPISVTTCSQS